MKAKIILASGSPRRRQILTLAGIAHEVVVSNADETIEGAPDFQVTELALRKVRAVVEMIGERPDEHIIIAADTLVYIDGKVLGKPADKAEAFEMLKSLSGREHRVYTGVALVSHSAKKQERVFSDMARVYFHELSDAEIHAYIATGEPFDKAGAYGVQERGAVLVEKIDGDFYTVVGLPISKVCRELAAMGFNVWA
ncbi:MAG: Maf family protein [Defluviitaleaceae bacterium]|nr:Maf family protein [Defluviitaleaceae bacterium]MCL2262179.1 Maf family protein [Defluviitaleaceae bacterium]